MAPESGDEPQFDVAVIGGGPGGSSAATALSRRGRRVLLLEREGFPRFHIGESQLPWINGVLEELGAHDTIAKAGFVEKWGASFWEIDGTPASYVDFTAAVETPIPQTFQVPRARWDELLLRHAERSGVIVREGYRAVDAAFEPDGVTLRYAGPDGVEQTTRVAAIVDASGRAGFLARKLGRHEHDPVLQQIAVHAQYEGIPRAEGRQAGDIRVLTRPDVGWIWLIPITETVTSVGAVVTTDLHRRESKATAEESLDHYLRTTPASPALMRDARRVSPARFDADYSIWPPGSWAIAGSRWAMRAPSSIRSSRPACCWPCRAGSRAAAIDAGCAPGTSRRTASRGTADGAEALSLLPPLRGGFYDPYFRRLLSALAAARDLRGGALRALRELAPDLRHAPAHPDLLRDCNHQAPVPHRAARRRRSLAPLSHRRRPLPRSKRG
jgi:2-polyprenyl-6-methoxyphenol hydroxylase-like FAD-dependent oxidoreductase